VNRFEIITTNPEPVYSPVPVYELVEVREFQDVSWITEVGRPTDAEFRALMEQVDRALSDPDFAITHSYSVNWDRIEEGHRE
jgi:hypothetical protein